MPPPQCPECGRFLSHGFVIGLREVPAPCPRCETTLTIDRFDADDLPDGIGGDGASVRPPDQPAPDDRDVLEGWDRPDADVIDLLAHRTPGAAPPSVVVGTVLAAGVAGGMLGAVVARRNRGFGVAVGTLAGAAGALLGMRMFEEGDPPPVG